MAIELLADPVFVLAPVGRDASVIVGMVSDAGLPARVIASFDEPGLRFADGAGLIVAAEAFERFDARPLHAWLEAQPPWSDFPIVFLRSRDAPVTPQTQAFIERLGNITILERPLHPITLVSAARSLVRSRRRQREAEAFLFERLKAAESLRESEERFRAAADSAPALIWMSDETGVWLYANRRCEEMFAVAAGRFLGDGWLEFVHEDDREFVAAAFAQAARDQSAFKLEFRVRAPGDEVRCIRCEAAPRMTDGHFVGHVGCGVDVTEAKLAADQLERRVHERTSELAAANRQLLAEMSEREKVEATMMRMQRLEAVGQLTAGVAHDFNNLLTVVLGNLARLERHAQEDDRRRLTMIRVAAERGAKLTGQLLAFSRRQRLTPKPTNLNDAILSLRDLLQSTLGASARLETSLERSPWPALVDPTQIEMIILNLAINARDAMPAGGAIRIETANATVRQPRSRPEEPEPGDYVMLCVTDNGEGMSEAVLQRVFEPFFTTKEIGRGSGLGLSQVLGFCKQSGGGVRIETRLGRGTSVFVYLPRAQAAAQPRKPSLLPQELRAASKGGAILLVDDDEAVRDTTAAMLEELGFKVIQVGSGGGALEILDSERKIDLLLIDFAMPGMNGAEVARAATTKRPGLPILFVTGYADLAALADAGHPVIRKPFEEGELAVELASLLGEPDWTQAPN
ncbi:MAG TPA: ATP-binding protein [Caulobacteraceae bacterium]|nr:ATP-binding protein [Caulobacteraceae bacterium]